MVSCNFATEGNEWIMDSADLMTRCMEVMVDVECTKEEKINLPTSETSLISHSGNVKLRNGILLYIPNFKHNLLSVQNLSKDQNIKIEFHL